MPQQSKPMRFSKIFLFVLMMMLAFTLGWAELPSTAQASGSIKMGFVDVNDVFVRFDGTNAAIEEFEQRIAETQTELQLLRVRLAVGEITEEEFFIQQIELQAELLLLNQQLTSEVTNNIIIAAETVGAELNLDLITPLDNVVVHGQSDVTVELTDIVLDVMNANFEGTEFDLNIGIDPEPLQRVGLFVPGEVIINYNGTLDAIQPLRDRTAESEDEKADLQSDLNRGQITQEEYNEAIAEIDTELAELEQSIIDGLVAEISAGVGRLGEAAGFDLISVRQNVILFHGEGVMVDLSLDVARFMNLELRDQSYDLDRIELPTKAPEKIGFVDADQIFVDFAGTGTAIEEFRNEIEAAQAELTRLGQQLEEDVITQADFLERRAEIQTRLAELDQQLSAEITQQIVDTVAEIGVEEGFDIITPQSNVILYHNEERVEDLTRVVLERMNSN